MKAKLGSFFFTRAFRAFAILLLLAFMHLPNVFLFARTYLPDKGDCFHNIWTYGDTINRIVTPGRSIFEPNILFPDKNVFTYQEPQFANTALYFVINTIVENPIFTFNIMTILGFALTGLMLFLILDLLCGDFLCSLLGAIAFTFTANRFPHVPHIQVICFFWLLMPLYFLIRYFRDRRKTDLLAYGGTLLLGVASIGYLPFYLGLLIAIFLGTQVHLNRRATLVVAGFSGLILVSVLPFYLPFLRAAAAGHARDFSEMKLYSIDLSFFFAAPAINNLYGGVTEWFRKFQIWGDIGGVFSGFVLLAIEFAAVFAIYRERRTTKPFLRFFQIGAVFFFLMLLGPEIHLRNRLIVVNPVAFVLMKWVPGFQAFRFTASYFWPFLFCAVSLAAVEISKWTWRWSPQSRVLMFMSVFFIMFVESRATMSGAGPFPHGDAIPAHYVWLKSQPPAPLIELPISQAGWDVFETMYYSIYHGRKIVNGITGFAPSWAFDLERTSSPVLSDEFFVMLRSLGFHGLIVLNKQHDTAFRAEMPVGGTARSAYASLRKMPLQYQDSKVSIVRFD
jgi:hypothetical protein